MKPVFHSVGSLFIDSCFVLKVVESSLPSCDRCYYGVLLDGEGFICTADSTISGFCCSKLRSDNKDVFFQLQEPLSDGLEKCSSDESFDSDIPF